MSKKRYRNYKSFVDNGEEEVVEEKFYRERRGELVEIPEKWVGKTLDPQTKRKRPSKLTRKARNNNEVRAWRHGTEDYHGRSLSMEKLKHMQGDYLDDEIE